MAPRETENNAYAKFWRDKQRTLWYVMVFLEWSIGKFTAMIILHFQCCNCSKQCRANNRRCESSRVTSPY